MSATPSPLREKKLRPGGADPLASPSWYLAQDLRRRLRTLRSADLAAADPPDGELASRRLERWRSQAPFAADDLWDRRLEAAGLTEGELRILLGEPPEALRARTSSPPSWLDEIERAYRATVCEPFPWPESVEGRQAPFTALAEPLIRSAADRLAAQARELRARHPDAPFDAEAVGRKLAGHLPELLNPMINRALVVELHAARLEGRLAGETPDERFAEFAASLRRRDVALEILERYPVLARELVRKIGQWEERGVELLGHLAADVSELRSRFAGGEELGLLAEARGAAGDPHRDGRSVFILRFDSDLRLVYKPRSLAVERAFQALLGFFNHNGFEPAFRRLEVFDAGDHGWVEFVEPAPCTEAEEVRRFYRRMGGHLALLYLLDGTDFHHENLIAAGEHPVLVDLETLFQPWVNSRALHGVERLPGAPLRDNVLRTNLLPERMWGTDERAGVDLSGLASQPGQLTPRPVLTTTARGTDEMRFERRRLEIPEGVNRPRLGDRDVSVVDHGDELRSGFESLYELARGRRRELADEAGPLRSFAEAEVRVLVRTTAAYGALLLESFHPHVLGNALERLRLFDRLWSDVEQRPFLERLIPFEVEDLARGDVPLFTARPESRSLWTSEGKELRHFFEESGLERVQRRLATLSARGLARQQAMIRDSLQVVRLASGPSPRPSYELHETPQPARRDELQTAALRVGERLAEQAFQGPEEALWMTVDHREPEGWRLAPAGPDVYMGLPGIALALGYLGDLAGDAELTSLARGALRAMANQIETDSTLVQGIGCFNGWGGIVYVLTHLGALWGDEALLGQAETYATRLPALIAEDDLLDLVAGSAGCALALLSLNQRRPSEFLVQTARACGERLLAKAERQERGIGWAMPLAGNRALAGISHGAAGIALALLRLSAETGDERFRRCALEGLEYERGLYSPGERNWPDLRAGAAGEAGPDGSSGPSLWAWCHGAPGIGLARLAGLPYLDDAAVRRDLELAISATLENGFGHNHCLCHGDLGNLDFLLEAARALGDRELSEKVYRLAGGILRSLEDEGRLFGLPGNVETPSLMVGLAGLAYGLARLAAPDRLPSVLAVAPPPESRVASG